VLELGLAAAGEVLLVAVGSKTGRVPEANRVLDAEFVLERAKRRGGVKGKSSFQGSLLK
jgi:hypothetical protein